MEQDFFLFSGKKNLAKTSVPMAYENLFTFFPFFLASEKFDFAALFEEPTFCLLNLCECVTA